MALVEKPKIKTLITEAQKGDQDAVVLLVRRFIPVVKKYSRWMGYEEAYADLVVWIVSTVNKYKCVFRLIRTVNPETSGH